MTYRRIDGDFGSSTLCDMNTPYADNHVIEKGDEYTYCRHDPEARWTPVRENLCTRTKAGMTVAEVKKIFRADLSGGHFTQDQIDRRVAGYAVRKIFKPKTR